MEIQPKKEKSEKCFISFTPHAPTCLYYKVDYSRDSETGVCNKVGNQGKVCPTKGIKEV